MVIPKLFNFYYHNQALKSTAEAFEYKIALDYAKGKNHPEIVNLLSNGRITLPKQIKQKTNTTSGLKSKSPNVVNQDTNLNSELSKLNRENSQLKEETIQLKKEINRLKEATSQLQRENDQSRKRNDQLQRENDQSRKRNDQLQKENDQLKSFLSALKEKLVNFDSLRFNGYAESSVIGEGATSTVKVISRQEQFAKKELKLFDHKSLQRFLKESEILVQLRHPCIVRIVGFDYGESTRPPSIFLSLEPSSLENSIQKHELTNEEKNRITVEIVLGMRYIHSNNLIHRDLKPSNILLSKNKHVRISDFGLAKEEYIETTQSAGVGTLPFMAPELFDEENEQQERYTSKVDVYSFGIVLIYIVSEQYPKYNMKKKFVGVLPTLPSTIVPWVVELINRCLQSSANFRPTFNDIFEVLKSHDFDLFNETKPSKPTIQQRKTKEEIEQRILKIEAFEYQHQL